VESVGGWWYVLFGPRSETGSYASCGVEQAAGGGLLDGSVEDIVDAVVGI
jgi:hypothetical protein